MTDNVVVTMPTPMTVLADRIRAAYRRTECGRQEWIEGTLELAAALAEARQRFPSNNTFGAWLGENGLDYIGAHDRSALIEMAGTPDLLRTVLVEQTEQLLPNTIWQKTRSRFEIHFKTEHLPPIVQIPISTAPEPATSVTAPAKSAANIPPLDKRSSFYGRERADEVHATFQLPNCRVIIAKALKGRPQIWNLILDAIDAGFLTPNKMHPSYANLGLLFPSAPPRFKNSRMLTHRDDLKTIVEQIMPAALANRDAILADPERIEQIIREHDHKVRAAIVAQQQARKVETAKAAMKANETEVILFGKTWWPIVGSDHWYDFETLRSAVWIFREMHSIAKSHKSDPQPRSCALHIRHMIKFMWKIGDQMIAKPHSNALHLVIDLSRAMERHGHDDPGERPPTMPITDSDE